MTELILFYILFIPALIVFCISLYNFSTHPVIEELDSENDELVSVLIPARNEEKNIAECLKSVISQSYKNIEVLVFDDLSEDNTYNNALSVKDSRVKVIKGNAKPDGWTGKNYACHCLSNEASGKYLLFIDADVRLEPRALSSALVQLQKSGAGLFSVFPTQILVNKEEFLVTPLMNWFLLSFLPLRSVYKSNRESLTAANGQFMLWPKEEYCKIGGHSSFRNEIVEDMEMAKSLKRTGVKVLTLLGGKLIFCRMYNSFKEGLNGFSKNFYSGTKLKKSHFIMFISAVTIVYTLPLLLSFLYPRFLFIFIMLTTGRGMISSISQQNNYINMLLNPVQIIVMFYTGIRSAFFRKEILWKNRPLNQI